MNFQGILSPDGTLPPAAENAQECFKDLNLDQVWEAMAARRPDYDLAPFFSAFPLSLDAALWRQEILRDLEGGAAAQALRIFSKHMKAVRDRLRFAEKSGYALEQKRWFLGGAEAYVAAVKALCADLDGTRIRSRGLGAFYEWLKAYAASDAFVRLDGETERVALGLAALDYAVFIKGDRVTVSASQGEPDLAVEVESIFARFRRGPAEDYRVKFEDFPGMNHVEAQILERVARVHPEPFKALERHCDRHVGFVDAILAVFEREVQFYLAVLEHVETLKHGGLDFCYPELSTVDKAVEVHGAFDLALARKLASSRGGTKVVRNDFELKGTERVLVVSGPNQGGKTTFARMVGQIQILASLGCPVPSVKARLFLCDRVFTHFERGEEVADLRSKLEDDLLRVRDILTQAGPSSLMIVNEIFSSTALKDALVLGREILRRVCELDALCVCVTFLEELASFSFKTVSMVSSVDPADPAERTFHLERRPADGMAHALALAGKHRVTGAHLRARLAS